MPNPSSNEPLPPAPAQKPLNFLEFTNPNDPVIDRLVQSLDKAYNRPWLMMWRSFLQGVMTAIGASVGTILIIAIIGFTVSKLGGIELFRPGIEKLQDMITAGLSTKIQNAVPTINASTQLKDIQYSPSPEQ
jgi:hypothetical protein